MASAEPAPTEVTPEPTVPAPEAPDVTAEPNATAEPSTLAESDGGRNLWVIAVIVPVLVIGVVVTRLRKRPTT